MAGFRITSDGRSEAALRAALEGLAAPPADVLIFDVPLPRALELARSRTGSARVLALVTADEAPAALDAMAGPLHDVVVLPAHPGELRARAANQARLARDVKDRGMAVRTLAHDVNNPLTAIRLLAEMMSMDVQDPEAAQDVQDVLEAADLAGALMDNQSALTKLESETGPGAQVSFDLAATAIQVGKRACLGQAVHIQAPRHPLLVRCNRTHIQQATLELLLNARRLAEGHGPPQVRVCAEGPFAILEVRIPRQRVPDAAKEGLRTPWRAWEARESNVNAVPTGLAVSHRVATLAGGELDIHATDEGATFRLAIPLSSAD